MQFLIPECIVRSIEDQVGYTGCLTGIQVFCRKDQHEEVACTFRLKFEELLRQEIRATFYEEFSEYMDANEIEDLIENNPYDEYRLSTDGYIKSIEFYYLLRL